MSKTLLELIETQPAVAITAFAGGRHRGHLISLGLPVEAMQGQPSVSAFAKKPIQLKAAGNGAAATTVDWESVKAIHFIKDIEAEHEDGVRFFDSAAIPPYLWVRVAFTDGELIEGKIDNELSLINGAWLMLYPLDDAANHECVCIPRTAIASLQVITFRR